MTSTSIYPLKICSICNTSKHISEFAKSKITKDLLQYKCKSCTKLYNIEYRKCNTDKRIQYNKLYRNTEEHKLIAVEYQLNYKIENKESLLQYQSDYRKSNTIYFKTYRQEHSANINYHTNKRRAAKLNATPNWAEFDLIKQLYIDCKLISEMTGILHHVTIKYHYNQNMYVDYIVYQIFK